MKTGRLKNIINLALILLLVLPVKNTTAQQDSVLHQRRKNNIQISFGFNHTRMIDEGFTQSKLLFSGTNPKIGLRYGQEKSASVFGFNVAINAGHLRTSQSKLATDFLNVSSAIEYLRKIKTFHFKKNQSQLFAGLQLSTINYIIKNDPVFDNVDAVSLHGIYFKGNYRLLWNKQSLEFTCSMPAIVYTNRVLWNSGASVYDFDDTKRILRLLTTHGRYYYFNWLKNIQADAVYTKRMKKNVDFNISYAFRFLSNSIGNPIHLYSNELVLGLKFNFK